KLIFVGMFDDISVSLVNGQANIGYFFIIEAIRGSVTSYEIAYFRKMSGRGLNRNFICSSWLCQKLFAFACFKFLYGFFLVLNNIIECRKAQEVKYVINLGIHIGEFDIAALGTHILNISHENAESCTGNIVEFFTVDDNMMLLLIDKAFERIFKLRSRMCVQFSAEL